MPAESNPTDQRTARRADRVATKRKKQMSLIAILVVVLVIALFTAPSKHSGENVSDASPVASLVSLKTDVTMPRSDTTRDLSERFIQTRTLPRIEASQFESADLFQRPFVPEEQAVAVDATKAPGPVANVKLGAIYGAYKGDRRSALIDGKIVRPGDSLRTGAKILSISPDEIRLTP